MGDRVSLREPAPWERHKFPHRRKGTPPATRYPAPGFPGQCEHIHDRGCLSGRALPPNHRLRVRNPESTASIRDVALPLKKSSSSQSASTTGAVSQACGFIPSITVCGESGKTNKNCGDRATGSKALSGWAEKGFGRKAPPGPSPGMRTGQAARAGRTVTGCRRPAAVRFHNWRMNARMRWLSGVRNSMAPRLKALNRFRRAIRRFIHHSVECGLACCTSTLMTS